MLLNCVAVVFVAGERGFEPQKFH